MGWYFNDGGSRKDLIAGLVEGRTFSRPDGVLVKTKCLAHCYRGGVFSGVLWTVFQRQYLRDEQEAEPTQRWIGCDLLQCYKGDWGYKPITESMGPMFYSVPLSYLKLVPIESFGGNEEWRSQVIEYHSRQAAKRRLKIAVRC
jgi:hypothetical protein